jgi:apolipoprotein N-acyltransferase
VETDLRESSSNILVDLETTFIDNRWDSKAYGLSGCTPIWGPSMNIQAQQTRTEKDTRRRSGIREAILWAVVAVFCFISAHEWPLVAPLILVYAVALCRLTELESGRSAFYSGLIVGSVSFASQLGFFWHIFGPAAIVLWIIVGFWTALFVFTVSRIRNSIGDRYTLWAVPLIWFGFEYFRSELYYLKFSWLTLGSPFVERQLIGTSSIGNYGTGSLLILLAFWISRKSGRSFLGALTLAASALIVLTEAAPVNIPIRADASSQIRIGGIQLEFPEPTQITDALSGFVDAHPDVDLIVLSEYSIQTTPPNIILSWCRSYKKHLIIGGKEPAQGSQYYNTAFVVGPEGTILFKQAKSEPIQFFDDGEAATSQSLWHSPWGKIGIGICYDLSFTKVTDELIRQGAQPLIIPTMDVVEWGEKEHLLHAKIAPIRATEYRTPIIRIASSGISQSVDRNGSIRAQTSFPGQGDQIYDNVSLVTKGQLPWDRRFGPIASILSGLAVLAIGIPNRPAKKKSVGIY